MPGINYPLVNGNRYSFASIEAWIDDISILGITSINYSDKLEPGMVKGTSMNPIGRTAGDRTSTCDVEILRLEWNIVLASLAAKGFGSYGLAVFDITVMYTEFFDVPTTTDRIRSCRITEAAVSNQSGTDPLKVKLTISPLSIEMNGVPIAPADFV